MVENNAAQDFIRQFADEAGIPTRPFTTGRQKADLAFGIPSLGVELEQGLWRLPKEPALLAWRTQCLAYSPGQHVGDLLMASWFAREAARTGAPPLEVGFYCLLKTPSERLRYGPPDDLNYEDVDGEWVRDDLRIPRRRPFRYGYEPR